MLRENGFYWVVLDGKWIVAEWDNGDSYQESCWLVAGSPDYIGFNDASFSQILENKLTPPQ